MIKCKELLTVLSNYTGKEVDMTLCDNMKEKIQNCKDCVIFIDVIRELVSISKAMLAKPIPESISERLHRFLKAEIREKQFLKLI